MNFINKNKFSFKNFFSSLKESLVFNETAFLRRSLLIAGAHLLFLGFGIATISSLIKHFGIVTPYSSVIFMAVSFFLIMWLQFRYAKWTMNPLVISKETKTKNYLLLYFVYAIFLVSSTSLISEANIITTLTGESTPIFKILDNFLVSWLLFGGTGFLYLIIATISYCCINQKYAIKLFQILKYFSYCLITFFVCSLIISLTSSNFYLIYYLVISIIIFIQPLLTIYRLKEISKCVELSNKEIRDKWQSFFVFSILFEILFIIIIISRFFTYISTNK